MDELICNVSLYYSEDEEPMILQETHGLDNHLKLKTRLKLDNIVPR